MWGGGRPCTEVGTSDLIVLLIVSVHWRFRLPWLQQPHACGVCGLLLVCTRRQCRLTRRIKHTPCPVCFPVWGNVLYIQQGSGEVTLISHSNEKALKIKVSATIGLRRRGSNIEQMVLSLRPLGCV